MSEIESVKDKISPDSTKVGNLFLNGVDRTFIIPHYQRDYSWNLREKQPQQFYEDIVDRLKIIDDEGVPKCECQSYFIGTMLFKGDWNDSKGILEVIDGQQRLTTTYLFLGALSNRFCKTSAEISELNKSGNNELTELSEKFKKFGKAIREQRLQTQESPNNARTSPRLNIEIGMTVVEALVFRDQSDKNDLRPECQAELNLIEVYNFIYNQLSMNSLSKILAFSEYLSANSKPTMKSQSIELLSPERQLRVFNNYLKILFGIREQLDAPAVVVLSMQSEKQVNEVFESLNSKGKNLEQIDLIKNNVFERLPPKPRDHARRYWGSIKDILAKKRTSKNTSNPWIDLSTFFSIYWIAVEGGSGTQANLYRDFLKEFGKADQINLIDFLKRADDFAIDVASMYGNRPLEGVDKNYLDHAKDGLRYLVRVQAARQCYPVLAAALHACRKGALPSPILVELLDYLAVAFIFLRDIRGSKYTSYLRSTAYCLASTVRDGWLSQQYRKELATWYVRNLEDNLSDLLQGIDKENLIEYLLTKSSDFEYSNKIDDEKAHTRVRYLLRVYCYTLLRFSKAKELSVATEACFTWNVEHILPDDKDIDFTHKLGNLLWIDKDVNDQCENKPVAEKIQLYTKSHNPEISELSDFFKKLQGDEKMQETAIAARSRQILRDLYDKVIAKPKRHNDRDGEFPQDRADGRLLKCLSNLSGIGGIKNKLSYMRSNGWFCTFISLNSNCLCSIKSTQLKKQLQTDEAFRTPFLLMKEESSEHQIGTIIGFIKKLEDTSRKTDQAILKSNSRQTEFSNLCKVLTVFKMYLLSEHPERE